MDIDLENLDEPLVLTLKSLCVLLAVVGNSLVIIAVLTDKGVRRVPNNIFICSLAISDLLIGAFVMPVDMFKIKYCWLPPDDVGKVVQTFRWIFLRASIWTLVVISFDRYHYVKGVRRYKHTMAGYRVIIGALFGWFMGVVYSTTRNIAQMIGGTEEIVIYIVVCSIDFFVPTIIMSYFYNKILRLTNQRTKNSVQPEGKLILRRTSLIIGILIFTFILIYLPEYVVNVYFRINFQLEACNVLGVAWWVVYSNAMINPVVYALFNESFRGAIFRIFKCTCRQHRFDSVGTDNLTGNNGRPSTRPRGSRPVTHVVRSNNKITATPPSQKRASLGPIIQKDNKGSDTSTYSTLSKNTHK